MEHDEQERAPGTAAKDPLPGSNQDKADRSLYVVLLATAGLLLARIPVIALRRFDPDEFEHAHAAWCVWKGMIPYKDLFEHHTPWYHYLLSTFFRWFDVAGSFESGRHFLILGRGLSLALTVLTILLIIRAGRIWNDRRVGVLAGFLLVGQPVFFQKTLEIRPDVLALPFFLGALVLLLRALSPTATRQLRNFFLGGLCLGASIMCTQKMLFVLPGMCMGLGVWALLGEDWPRRRSRLIAVAILFLGLAIPFSLTWFAFTLGHAGSDMIRNNFLLNAHWKYVVHQQLLRVLEGSWPVLILALLGAAVVVYHFIRSKHRRYDGFLLVCILLGLIAGILVVPVAHRQYYLMPIPIACLLAARAGTFLVDLAQQRTRAGLLLLATIPLAVLPVLGLREAFDDPNDQQLARLHYVYDNTKPTDLMMDGWEGTGVFRPHAFYYYFIHEELVPMLPRDRVDALLHDLEQGKTRPRLIALDKNLIALGSRFVGFVERNYVTKDDFFYLSAPPPGNK